jgi:vacuolar-type H+-ATPase subunit I/STV1
MFDANNNRDSSHIEKRLAEALSGINVEMEAMVEEPFDIDLSARELLQMAWDRAEQEIDELRTELRILQQRHREAERNLTARINQRKRLQQQILQSAGEPTQVA